MHNWKKEIKKGKKMLALSLATLMLAAGVSACGNSGGNTESGNQEVENVSVSSAEENNEGGDLAAGSDEADSASTEAEKQEGPSGTASPDGMLAEYNAANPDPNAPVIDGLNYESTLEVTYAEGYEVYFYEGGYSLISVPDSMELLLVPEGGEAPAALPKDMVTLTSPVDHIYLAATSAMALFASIDALDQLSFSSLEASGWYVDKAKEAMEQGRITYAGKYSEPDYEMLVSQECRLAIESTMILHTPKVQEMIEMLDIPVFIDRSSYESHPLGRTEWVKLYGVLTGHLSDALAMFDKQAAIINNIESFEKTDKKVAFFYISTDGAAVVRNSDDYIAKMIELAGGNYAFQNLGEVSDASNVTLSMEEFYSMAGDADYLIYNASIDSVPPASCEELIGKSELFRDFKAVQEGHVWSTDKSLYQATDIVGELIYDVHGVLTGADASEMTFLHQVK